MPDQIPQQDLGVSIPHPGDKLWARMRPIAVVATKERLDKEHQTVTVKNTSPNQKHIVLDRYMVGQLLDPGQEKSIEMLVDDIAYFRHERTSGRLDNTGAMLPKHPIVIDGVYDPDEPAKNAAPPPAPPSAIQQAAKQAG